LRGLDRGSDPKGLIAEISEDLLARFGSEELVSRYDVYQHLMDYWAEEMQDDVYAIAQDGWEVGCVMRRAYEGETPDLIVKKGNKTTRYVGELIPPYFVIARFVQEEQAEVDRLAAETEVAAQAKAQFEEDHGGEDGALSNVDRGKNGIPKGNVQNRVMELKEEGLGLIPMLTPEYEQIKDIKRSTFGTAPWEKGVQDEGDIFAELDFLHDYLRLVDEEAQAKKAYKEAVDALDQAVLDSYPELTEEEIKALVVDDKWIAAIEQDVRTEIERVAQTVAGRVKILEERYAEPLPTLAAEVENLTEQVEDHLREMGLDWAGRL
jgi:type I restriction enzyme M protein